MRIVYDTTVLELHQLPCDQFALLSLLCSCQRKEIEQEAVMLYISTVNQIEPGHSRRVLSALEEKGWIDVRHGLSKETSLEDILIREELLKMDMFTVSREIDTDSLYDRYMALWPRGVKTRNGTYIRTDAMGAAKKKFERIVKSLTCSEEHLLAATKDYLEEQACKGYTHCVRSDYFIEKDGVSLLKTWCENFQPVEDTEINKDNVLPYWSRSL